MDRTRQPGTESTLGGEGPQSDSIADPVRAFVGQSLGDYRIRRVVGHGSMGVVFEAEQQSLKRRVALKVLPPSLTLTEKVIQRFLREAESVARLSHENIVPIYEIGHDQGVYFYAMQFIEGEPLDRLILRGQLSFEESARLALQAARAIHVAHQQGIIHRDLKPSNILVEASGRIVITDFGLARQEKSATITESGALVGTPVYMSPEQVRASRDEIDRRTDIYSLGATFYEMLAGEPAFCGNTTQEILQRILETEPRAPRKVRPSVPWELEVITLKAMEKDVARRYQTALAMADDLQRFLAGEPILARPSGIFYRSWKRMRKHQTITWLAFAVIMLVMVAIGATLSSQRSKLDTQYRMALTNAMSSIRARNYEAALAFCDGAALMRRNAPEAVEARALAHYYQAATKEASPASRDELVPLFSKAYEELARVAAHGTTNAEIFVGLADSLVHTVGVDKLTESLKTMERALQMAPQSYWVQLGAARYYRYLPLGFDLPRDQRIQLLERAYDHASQAVSIDHSGVEALLLRAEICLERTKDAGDESVRYQDMARGDVEAALKIDHNNYLAGKLKDQLNSKTVAADWRVKLAELGLPIVSNFARTQWENTSTIRDSAASTLSSFLGDETSEQKQKRLKDAEEHAETAAKLYQANPSLWPRVVEHYAKAFDLNPQMADYPWRGAQIALQHGDLEHAQDLIGKARRLAPGNALYAKTDLDVAKARGDDAKVQEILGFFSRNVLDYQRLFGQEASAPAGGQSPESKH